MEQNRPIKLFSSIKKCLRFFNPHFLSCQPNTFYKNQVQYSFRFSNYHYEHLYRIEAIEKFTKKKHFKNDIKSSSWYDWKKLMLTRQLHLFTKFFSYMNWTIHCSGQFAYYWEVGRVFFALCTIIVYPLSFGCFPKSVFLTFLLIVLDLTSWADIFIRFHMSYYNKQGKDNTRRWLWIVLWIRVSNFQVCWCMISENVHFTTCLVHSS